jgi:hypothetical protein
MPKYYLYEGTCVVSVFRINTLRYLNFNVFYVLLSEVNQCALDTELSPFLFSFSV